MIRGIIEQLLIATMRHDVVRHVGHRDTALTHTHAVLCIELLVVTLTTDRVRREPGLGIAGPYLGVPTLVGGPAWFSLHYVTFVRFATRIGTS
jgi:hypothetical protein